MGLKTEATRRLGIAHPIVQGPFGGGLSTAKLAATVANLGGLGSFGAHTLRPDQIDGVAREIRAITSRPFALNLWVSDHDEGGLRIGQEEFDRVFAIFEPYFRAEGGPNQNVPGTGLGLAICRRLSEMMNGTLSAVSEPGLGTSMSLVLTLPRVGGAQPEMGVRLDPRPVFVRGANNEVVTNLCQWLRHCGALAMPFKDALHGRREGSVLVETWTRDFIPAAWRGAGI